MEKGLIKFLSGFLTQERNILFDKVLEKRTRHLTAILEDLNHAQNASAVLRTCDCLGIQDVHIAENWNQFKVDTEVALGASKWLTIKKHVGETGQTKACLKSLKKRGYRILATSPDENCINLEDIDFSKGKIAVIFGSEIKGISETAREMADELITIPMFGFTESFNISVSAAIVLHQLNLKLRQSELNWQLSEDEKNEIKLNWLRKSLKSAKALEKKYLQNPLKYDNSEE